MEIVKYPTKSLFEKSVKIEEITNDIKNLALEMLDFKKKLSWGNPVGLAAPQIGKNIRLFIWFDKVIINPEVVHKSKQENYYKEGCYSLEENKFDYAIWRPQSIRVKYQDIEGKIYEEKLNGFKAQVFLHEFDHLEGKLCCGE